MKKLLTRTLGFFSVLFLSIQSHASPVSISIPTTFLGYSFSSEVDFDDINGDLEIQDFYFASPITPLIQLNDSFSVISEFHARYTEFDLTMNSLQSSSEAYDISVPLTFLYQRQDSDWKFFAILEPGFAAEAGEDTSDGLYLDGKLGVTYKVSDTLSLIVGGSHTRNFGEPEFLPFAGFEWRPSEDWLLEVKGSEFQIAYEVNDSLTLKAIGLANGGAWASNESGGQDLYFSSYQAGLGFDYVISENLTFSLTAGTTLFNEFELETAGTTNFDTDANSGFFVRTELQLGKW